MGIWFGWPLLLTGVLIPIPALWLSFQYSRLLQTMISEMGVPENEFGQMATSLIFNAAYALRNIWLGNVLLQAGLMFLLGVGGIFLAFSLKRRRPKSAPGEVMEGKGVNIDYAQ
ncbi:MAG: hypothetical protein KC419_11565 [Anaerolineales bacterium]|nr:hypothetical protein [Anaerolineales bacterium]